jgi:hypothetical protein
VRDLDYFRATNLNLDQDKKIWSAYNDKSSALKGRYGHSMAINYKYCYLFGGRTETHHYNELWVIDLDSWFVDLDRYYPSGEQLLDSHLRNAFVYSYSNIKGLNVLRKV